MSSTISYRKLDANGDPLFGNGAANFVTDIDAVAQAISTRLKLFEGEWWENLNTGTPLFQSILGQTNPTDAVSLILTQRILGTPYVLGVTNVQATYTPGTRAFSFACSVQTEFGTLLVTNQPTPPSASLSS